MFISAHTRETEGLVDEEGDYDDGYNSRRDDIDAYLTNLE